MTHEPTPSKPNTREFAPDDKLLPEFVVWVTANDKDAWLYYLCECGLEDHLAHFLDGSPFERGTHARSRMTALIVRFLRDKLGDDDRTREFRFALDDYIRDHALIQEHFVYQPPEAV